MQITFTVLWTAQSTLHNLGLVLGNSLRSSFPPEQVEHWLDWDSKKLGKHFVWRIVGWTVMLLREKKKKKRPRNALLVRTLLVGNDSYWLMQKVTYITEKSRSRPGIRFNWYWIMSSDLFPLCLGSDLRGFILRQKSLLEVVPEILSLHHSRTDNP